MRIRWRILACLCLGGLLVWFLADAGAVRDSVAEALALCARSVVPSLFPFLVASSALLALGFGELAAPWLAGLMEPLFRVPGAGSAALVLGLVGGYPIGAKTAADLYRENLVSREEAERLLAFCNNSNPVFLISVLGVGVFGSVRAGVWLWLIHVLSALLTGLVFRGSGKSASRQELTRHPPFQAVSFAEAFTGAVRSSLAGAGGQRPAAAELLPGQGGAECLLPAAGRFAGGLRAGIKTASLLSKPITGRHILS